MIQIKWTEIKIDVDKQTWRVAKVHIGDPELRNDAQEEKSKTSETFIMRFAESAFAMVSMAIREQLTTTMVDVATDALDMEKQKWEFTLKDNTDIDETALAMLIHNFMVAYIMYKWSAMWAQDYANQFQKDYTEASNAIVNCAFVLATPKKKTFPSEYEIDNNTTIEYECN